MIVTGCASSSGFLAILEPSVIVTSSVNILGGSYIGEEAYIGVNSAVHQNSKIGKLAQELSSELNMEEFGFGDIEENGNPQDIFKNVIGK